MQRRLLQDSMTRLHKKYCDEFPAETLSYSLFCLMRPFYVVTPTTRDRDTCLCKLHENSRMLIERVHSLNLLNVGTIEDTVAASVCSEPTKKIL